MAFVALAMAGAATCQTAAASIEFIFDYTYDTSGFFSDPTRRALLETAGNLFESKLGGSSLAAIPGTRTDAQGSNSWAAQFSNPSSGSAVSIANPTIAAN